MIITWGNTREKPPKYSLAPPYNIYRRFSKYSASLIIRHPMNNNEIISLKNFGMLRSCDVAELLVTTDTSSEATESDHEVKFIETREDYSSSLPSDGEVEDCRITRVEPQQQDNTCRTLVQVRLLYTHPLRGDRGRYQVGVALQNLLQLLDSRQFCTHDSP